MATSFQVAPTYKSAARFGARSSGVAVKVPLKITQTVRRNARLQRRQGLVTTCGDKVMGVELPEMMSGNEPLAHAWRSSIIVGSIAGLCKLQNSLEPETWNTYVGPGFCVAAALYVAFITINGKNEVAALKAELEAAGHDTTGINRIGMLKYLKEQVESGDEDQLMLARETIASGLCLQAMGFGAGPEFTKWRNYYREKGIDLQTVADLEKVREYVRDLRAEVEARKQSK
eukprot:CAMPEP_0197847344 /NCGR_PEP_ID=MMETSP1438-20131217/5746_1 /TAXON_ID=1461541 /ORGANISM="Pterosperma sp., Strain CCMP1384" /LENGTH=229 /DNA_ID=CAMNT_0043459233 /DNA_START=68 /DNA_END=757 /DNA_ORIENTATION=+